MNSQPLRNSQYNLQQTSQPQTPVKQQSIVYQSVQQLPKQEIRYQYMPPQNGIQIKQNVPNLNFQQDKSISEINNCETPIQSDRSNNLSNILNGIDDQQQQQQSKPIVQPQTQKEYKPDDLPKQSIRYSQVINPQPQYQQSQPQKTTYIIRQSNHYNNNYQEPGEHRTHARKQIAKSVYEPSYNNQQNGYRQPQYTPVRQYETRDQFVEDQYTFQRKYSSLQYFKFFKNTKPTTPTFSTRQSQILDSSVDLSVQQTTSTSQFIYQNNQRPQQSVVLDSYQPNSNQNIRNVPSFNGNSNLRQTKSTYYQPISQQQTQYPYQQPQQQYQPQQYPQSQQQQQLPYKNLQYPYQSSETVQSQSVYIPQSSIQRLNQSTISSHSNISNNQKQGKNRTMKKSMIIPDDILERKIPFKVNLSERIEVYMHTFEEEEFGKFFDSLKSIEINFKNVRQLLEVYETSFFLHYLKYFYLPQTHKDMMQQSGEGYFSHEPVYLSIDGKDQSIVSIEVETLGNEHLPIIIIEYLEKVEEPEQEYNNDVSRNVDDDEDDLKVEKKFMVVMLHYQQQLTEWLYMLCCLANIGTSRQSISNLQGYDNFSRRSNNYQINAQPFKTPLNVFAAMVEHLNAKEENNLSYSNILSKSQIN